MTDRLIRIKEYEQAADDKVSIGGIKWLRKWDVCIQCDSAEEAEALRARLAQPEPAECDGGQCGIGGYCKDCPKTKPELKIINMEHFVGSRKPLVPVCWMNVNDIDKTDWKVWAHGKPTISMPLFASPPQREWQGLTDEEIHSTNGYEEDRKLYRFARAIEAKLKEKNHG